MTLDASGRLLVGLTSTNSAFGGKLQVEGTSDAFASLVRYSSTAAGNPAFYFGRSKSATLGTNTIVASGDALGAIIFSGANGTGYSDAASIQGLVDGTPGASADMPGRLVFSTSADGSATPTERMRIDSSGNVGIGTSSPSTKFTVAGNANLTGNFYTPDFGYIGNSGGTFSGINTGFQTLSGGSGYLVMFTNGSERARIDSSGNLLVGASANPGLSWTSANRLFADQTAADFTCHVRNSSGTAANNYGIAISFGATPNGTGNAFIEARDATAQRFQVRSNGGIANFSGNNVNLSDRREKTNFAPAGDYLSKICAIPVQTFNYIDQNMEEDPGLTLGVVAQEVQDVAPELVMESNWGTAEEPKMRLSIYQTDLQYALMKCIQEQQQMIETLQAKVAALEGKK
jgi:hypothetical protein